MRGEIDDYSLFDIMFIPLSLHLATKTELEKSEVFLFQEFQLGLFVLCSIHFLE